MHQAEFDALTRNLSSRRTALVGLLGGVVTLLGLTIPEEVSAHDPSARCRKLKNAKRRRSCLRRARAHARTHVCKPMTPAAVCAGARRCDGLAVNNCGKLINCTCPVGKACTDNGSCTRQCPASSPTSCPSGCFCQSDVENANTCFAGVITDCAQIPEVCATSTECPPGFRCFRTGCSPASERNRCFPICEL